MIAFDIIIIDLLIKGYKIPTRIRAYDYYIRQQSKLGTTQIIHTYLILTAAVTKKVVKNMKR